MRIIFSLVFCLTLISLTAQEREYPLTYNKEYKGKELSQNKTAQLLSLPFVDDFSYDGPFPDPVLWTDEYAYINNTFAINPISIGLATLDGLGSNGLPHDINAVASTSLPADTLTSQFIDLSALSPSDDVYISFYYQAQGYGYEVGSSDSLLLQFKNSSDIWETAWYTGGIPLDDFQLAILKVDSADYFHDEFQFRFRNYASITGSNDQWHIDHVQMDANRDANDVILQDVAIIYEPSSILTNYTEMPWNQFYNYQTTELNSNHYLSMRNNDNVTINTTYEYLMTEVNTGDILASQAPQAINFIAGVIIDQQLQEPIDISTNYPGDTVEFLLDYTIDPSGDQYLQNNNVTKIQQFGNQMAYDDGSSELAYGINVDGAQLAMEYTVNEPDSLRAIAIFFTTIEEEQSDRFFSLIVWDDIDIDGNGANAIELARKDLQTPDYQPMHNEFIYYVFDDAVPVDGTFYIGMAQEGDEEFNLGYDKNNSADDYTYYNFNGEWLQSNLNGAVMMRPVLGGVLPSSVNVEEHELTTNISIHPNPTQDILYIDFSEITREPVSVNILNLNASTVYSSLINYGSIDISHLTDGMYIMELRNAEGKFLGSQKIIKN